MSILTNTLDSTIFLQESFFPTQQLNPPPLSSSESFTSASSLTECSLTSFVPMAVATAAELAFDPSLTFTVEGGGAGRRGSLDLVGPVVFPSQTQPGTVFVEEMLDFFIDPLQPQGLYFTSTVRPCPAEPAGATGATPASPTLPSYPSGRGGDKAQVKRERNRLAAERCRARKLNMISSLQEQCSRLRQERDQLMLENQRLKGILLGTPGPEGQRLGMAASLGSFVGRP